MSNVKGDLADRMLMFSRLLEAPIDLVWKIWTSPEHIRHWWGPYGFTNTIRKMDVSPGGKWDLTMHGPDGTDYEINCVFREVIKHRKIVYEQFSNFKCVATIEFESRGQQTFLYWQMLFESREYLIQAAKAYGVVDGLRQNAERLLVYLARQTGVIKI